MAEEELADFHKAPAHTVVADKRCRYHFATMDEFDNGKGIDGYVHYSLAMDRIREEEENRKALMDEFDNDEDNFDSDDLDSDDFSSDDFGSDDFGGDDF